MAATLTSTPRKGHRTSFVKADSVQAVIRSLDAVDRSDLAFIDAIRANLNDHLPKLVYADRLDELGETLRAELIRLEVAFAQHPEIRMSEVDYERLLELTDRGTLYDTDPPRSHAMFGFTPRLGITPPPWWVGREDEGLSMCNLHAADRTAFLTGRVSWPRQWSLQQMCGLFARNPVSEIRLYGAFVPSGTRWRSQRKWFVDYSERDADGKEKQTGGALVHRDAFDLLVNALRDAPSWWGRVVDDDGRRRIAFDVKKLAHAALMNLDNLATDAVREALWPGKYRRTAGVFL